MSATAAPREPAARTTSSSWPPARATSSRGTSAAQPSASPRIPESTTSGRVPSAASRSRTYAISAPFVSRVPISAMPGASATARSDRRALGRRQRLAQPVDRLLDLPVVVVLRQRAGPVVAQELLHPLARARIGGVGDLLAGGERRAVDGDDELDRQVVVVADPDQLAHELVPVDRALAARQTVVVGDVEVDQVVARVADRLGPVRLLDVHVEDVERHAAVAADVLGQRDGLVGAVEEVRLEAVERFEPDPHADLLRVRLALLEAVDGPLPLLLGRGHRDDLADRRGDDREDAAAEAGDERQAVLDVLHARHADVVVLVHEVAAARHERHRSPALEVVVVELPLDGVRVVERGLARDLDPVVAAAAEPGDRRLDRLGPHPVVHGHLHMGLLPSVYRPSLPGFMTSCGSSAVLICRIASSAAPCWRRMYGPSLMPTPWWSFMTPPASSAAVMPSFQIRSWSASASEPPSGTTKRP